MAFCRPRRPRRRRRSGRSPNLVCYGAEAVLEEVAFLSPCEDTLLKRGKNHAWKILGALLFSGGHMQGYVSTASPALFWIQSLGHQLR